MNNKKQLETDNIILWSALNNANKYLAKAVADGVLQDCVVPVSQTFKDITNILNETKATNQHG